VNKPVVLSNQSSHISKIRAHSLWIAVQRTY